MIGDIFKPLVVALILSGKTEDALAMLAKEYKVDQPSLKVGLPKGHKATAYACYSTQSQTISVQNSDILVNPFVVLHEFYHHLRSKGVNRIHKGTEGNADKFAMEFITAYEAFSSVNRNLL
jgi:hypothetical protein